MNGVVFGSERSSEGSLRFLGAGESYAGWRRGGRKGRRRKEEARKVVQRVNQVILVIPISILFGKSLEIIARGSPYSSHPRVLMAVVLMAVVIMAKTMVVLLLMLLMELMALFNARSGEGTGRR